MILAAEEGDRYDVYDANGNKLEWCVWCDTLTGEAVHASLDEKGLLQLVSDERGRLAARLEWRQHIAPLRSYKISDYKIPD